MAPSAGPWVSAATLEGRIVRLEPLAEHHVAGLSLVGLDPDIWAWMPDLVDSPERMRTWVGAAIEAAAAGHEHGFATIDRRSDRIVGSTRYLAIAAVHRRLEIGATWIAPDSRGRGLNDESKLLLLRHAFDVLGCQRVEFKTDARNARARSALVGIGATFEGISRKHMRVHGGRTRDSAWYRVVDDEWPLVERYLSARVEGHDRATPSPRSADRSAS